MNIEINTNGELIISKNYAGIGLQTDDGLFGVAQRDEGIEVMLDGQHVWSSDDRPPLQPVSFAVARGVMAAGLSDDDGTYTAYHANVAMVLFDDSSLDITASNDLAAKILNLLFDLKPEG